MEKPKKRHIPRSTEAPRPGEIARAGGRTLTSYRVAALPIINHVLERMRLDKFLRSYLPRADRRCRIAPSIGISLLLKNVLLAREPLYGIGEWAAKFDPKALGFADDQLPSLERRPRRADVSIACFEPTSLQWSWHWRPMWSRSSRLTSTSCTTTPPRSPSTVNMPMPLGNKSGANRPGWRSPGVTTRTIGPTSSNYSSSSQWPGTARSLCISRSPAATWWTTKPISPPGTSSVAWSDAPTSCTWRTANWPPRKTWPISINTTAGSSPCFPGRDPRTRPSGTCSSRVRSCGDTFTTSEMTKARSWTSTPSATRRC